MLRAFARFLFAHLDRWRRTLLDEPAPVLLASPAPLPLAYAPLEKIVLTDSVARSLFGDFAAHRQTHRGDEEIGWILMGIRHERHALALATLPAGTQRSAGVAHVHFNSQAQAAASIIVRQWDKRLTLLGVVHTHPGSLRHPSGGDFQGDSQWVGRLRGAEGVFGIGTADVAGEPRRSSTPPLLGALSEESRTPEPHRQALGELCFSWYALGDGDRRYRPLRVEITLGPDLARPLHPLWDVLEEHAEALERLARQQNQTSFEVVHGPQGDALAISFPLATPGAALKVLLDGRQAQYLVQEHGRISAVDPEEARLDRAVYLILAELCGRETSDRPKEKSHGLPTSQRHRAQTAHPGPARQRRG